ncbi:MAG: general secretion pathway protein GspK [Comamonadaceae bacterium]|nr:MAG: general secretion pathway protein GspK [Comamonadaceae bacterium]
MTRRQRGAALLMAMLTVTLVATFAAAAMWQQWRSVEVETAERSRVQAAWVLTGALDWARLILREDARSGGADHLAEPWAVPLQEARLSTFLSADKPGSGDTTDTSAEAFMSGQINDLQARMNIFNLVENGRVSEPSMRAFGKLFELLGIPPQQLSTLAENLRFASDTSADNGSGSLAPLLPQRVEQLVWLGLSPQVVAQLQPYVTLLPTRTPVNLNTAPVEVIYATVPTLEMADAQRIVTERDRAHFRTVADAGKLVGDMAGQFADGQHSVASRYFEVRGRLRLENIIVEERSVVQRDGLDVKTLWRERGVPTLPAAALATATDIAAPR